MSLYDALSTVYDGVNKNPQNMLLLALTFLARVSPGKNSDRSIVLARLMDYVASIECQGNDPEWLTKVLERTHEKEVKSKRWNSSRISVVRDRPRIPVAPSLSPFSQKQRRGKPRRAQSKGLKSKFIKDPNTRRKFRPVPGRKNIENAPFGTVVGTGNEVTKENQPNDDAVKLSKAQLEISKAMSAESITSAVIESCHALLASFDFVSLYLKRGDRFESRLPHERKPTIVANTSIGIFGYALRQRTVVSLTAENVACSDIYDKVVDSFQSKPCHIIYAPVLAGKNEVVGIIKVCRRASEDSFTTKEIQNVSCIAKQTAVSVENGRIASGSLALSKVVNEITSSLDIRETSRKLCNAAKKMLQCDSAMIFIMDWEKQTLSSTTNDHALTVPADESSFVGTAAIGKRIISASKDVQKNKRLCKRIEGIHKFETHAIICFPMIDRRGNVAGVLRVANKAGAKMFSRRDKILLNGLAQTAMVVLANARIHDAAMADRVKTDSLLRVAKALNEQENLLDLISRIQQEAKLLLECDRISVFLHDSVTNELYTVAIGDDGTPFEIRFPSNLGLAGFSFTQSKMINVEDAWEDPKFNNAFDIQTGYRTKSVLVVHIKNHVGENIGVVQCINKALDEKFGKMDELLLDAFASQCAVAIENLRNAERLADLQQYFSQHEASAYDIFFEIDMDRNIIDISRDSQSANIFTVENVTSLIGKRFDIWLGKQNRELMEQILIATKMPNGMLLKEMTFIVPGKGGQTLVLDMNIVPVIHKFEKGKRVNQIDRNYTKNLPLLNHANLFEYQHLGSFLIYCSSIRVKQSSGSIQHMPNFRPDDYENDIIPMLSICLNCSTGLRQKAIVGIGNEIQTAKGFIHQIENNTIIALFGLPHSTNKDITTVIDVGNKVISMLEMMEDAEQLSEKQEELSKPGHASEGKGGGGGAKGGAEGEVFLTAHAGVTSAKVKVWDRWTTQCRYEVYHSSVGKSHWIVEQCSYYGVSLMVDADIAMHLPARVVTRKIGNVVWAGDAVNIQMFHHLTPFEQQRASLMYLEKTEALDMALVSSEVYEVLNDKEIKEGKWLLFFDKGVAAFKSQLWSRAIKYFNESLRLKNDDLTSRTYIHISAKMLRSHVSFSNASWNGLWQAGCEIFLLKYFGVEVVDLEVWNGEVLPYSDIQPRLGEVEAGNASTGSAGNEAPIDKLPGKDTEVKIDVFKDGGREPNEEHRSGGENVNVGKEEDEDHSVEKQEAKKPATSKEDESVDRSEPSNVVVAEDDVMWVLARMWSVYSSSSSVTLQNLAALFNDFTHSNFPPEECIGFFRSMMDVSTDDNVEQRELANFVQRGLALSDEARAQYGSEGMLPTAALKLFDSIKEKIVVRNYVQEMWPQLDVSMAGYLTPAQTKSFIEAVSETEISEEDCKIFINSIDENKDNKIEKEELIDFILHGLNLDNEQREAYASRGGSQKELIAFFDALRERAGIVPVIPLRDKVEMADDKLLQDFFSAVDTDTSGTISKKEMLRAMRKTKLFELIAAKHNKLRPLLRGKTYLSTFESINASGTSEITYEELRDFVHAL